MFTFVCSFVAGASIFSAFTSWIVSSYIVITTRWGHGGAVSCLSPPRCLHRLLLSHPYKHLLLARTKHSKSQIKISKCQMQRENTLTLLQSPWINSSLRTEDEGLRTVKSRRSCLVRADSHFRDTSTYSQDPRILSMVESFALSFPGSCFPSELFCSLQSDLCLPPCSLPASTLHKTATVSSLRLELIKAAPMVLGRTL